MSRYKFNAAERYAVFTVHRERCWLCEEPVSLSEMQVDHIIPESLEGQPELGSVLDTLGLPRDFGLNSFSNWMPAHPICNRSKGDHVFRLTPAIQMRLEKAAARADEAREKRDKYLGDKKIDKALNDLLIAHEQGSLTKDQIERLICVVQTFHNQNRVAEERGKPLFLAPWLKVLGEREGFVYVQGPSGMVGVRPTAPKLDPSWDCPRCGITAWNGVRCVSCGMMDDGD